MRVVENVVKTKQVSEMVGVDQKTIRKWTKEFDIPFERNQLGHYVFTKEAVRALADIKNKKRISESKGQAFQMVKGEDQKVDFGQKLSLILRRLDYLEEKLSRTADEVVSYQVLEHRKEIDDLVAKVQNLSHQFEKLQQEQQPPKALSDNKVQQQKLKRLFNMFHFNKA